MFQGLTSGTLRAQIRLCLTPSVLVVIPHKHHSRLLFRPLRSAPLANSAAVPAPATPELTEWIDQNEIRTSEVGLALFDGKGRCICPLCIVVTCSQSRSAVHIKQTPEHFSIAAGERGVVADADISAEQALVSVPVHAVLSEYPLQPNPFPRFCPQFLWKESPW